MKARDISVLMDKATQMYCPLCLGHLKRNCVANNCQAWRFRKEGEFFYGWCGLAGICQGENDLSDVRSPFDKVKEEDR